MRRKPLAIAVLTAGTVAASLLSAPALLTGLLAIPVMLFVPGHVWAAVVLPGRLAEARDDGAARDSAPFTAITERATVEVGLSLALLVLCGLLIAAVGVPLRRGSWLVMVAALIGIGIVAGSWQQARRPVRLAAAAASPAAPPRRIRLRPRRLPRAARLWLAAVLIAAGAVTTAIVGAKTAPSTPFTSLGFVAGPGHSAAVAVHNEEGAPRNYVLVVKADGTTDRKVLSLQPGESWQQPVSSSAGTEADLYLSDDAGRLGPLYRTVTLRSQFPS